MPITVYRVGDRIDGKRHLAYSAVNSAFCGRVGSGPKFQWRVFCKASWPLPSGVSLCRQCERSQLKMSHPPTNTGEGGSQIDS